MKNKNEIIRNALKTPQEYTVIGEVRGEELELILDAMKNNTGHTVRTTMMCENQNEVVTKFMNKYESVKQRVN